MPSKLDFHKTFCPCTFLYPKRLLAIQGLNGQNEFKIVSRQWEQIFWKDNPHWENGIARDSGPWEKIAAENHGQWRGRGNKRWGKTGEDKGRRRAAESIARAKQQFRLVEFARKSSTDG